MKKHLPDPGSHSRPTFSSTTKLSIQYGGRSDASLSVPDCAFQTGLPHLGIMIKCTYIAQLRIGLRFDYPMSISPGARMKQVACLAELCSFRALFAACSWQTRTPKRGSGAWPFVHSFMLLIAGKPRSSRCRPDTTKPPALPHNFCSDSAANRHCLRCQLRNTAQERGKCPGHADARENNADVCNVIG